jgi:hypothetical protein
MFNDPSNRFPVLGSIVDHNKQIRIVRTQGRLRMLVEQLPDGRKRLHLKGRYSTLRLQEILLPSIFAQQASTHWRFQANCMSSLI